MEHEKKKRGKKKKNKQGKTSVSAGVGELTTENNNHANVANQNHQNVNSDSSDVPKRGLQQAVVDSDRESISGAETSRSVEAEKSYWLNREASLEQKIKELQEQLDIHVQREADLERNISQSQKERNSWHHKETELEATISQLQTEKRAWLQKEADCEEKLNRLVEETSTLRSMEACFEEKRIQMETEKVNLAQRENSAAETIASLIKDNAKLQAQVIELETSSNNISHQNQQLKEHVSDLQSKIQDLENSVATHLSSERTKNVTAYEDMNLQLESAQALVAKLLSENDILVEKVNVLKTELDQKTATTQSSSPIKPVDPLVKNPKAADMDETSTTETDSMPSSAETDTVSNVGPSDTLVNHMHSEGSDLNQISRVSMESGEIVQISLNEIDVAAATSAIYVPEDADPVPLTDAPLIGAPFRFISFVARYVSGADLVQK
ncbi:hypothetical protein L1987_03647 [Smallanthus sonchifolius]|uniref:Uncharacterized protein n=1 Tax=Smallanthus sonchifolius TaxID=185202 RepID=A0ACB9KB60_9ASTR|nr:hypothetical protein L1987_03647 [Smallanthus sonchifolius]